jgi:hypothetical protein
MVKSELILIFDRLMFIAETWIWLLSLPLDDL